MSNTKIFGDDELIQTTVHGFRQDVFLVTEDKMKSFNDYSFDLKLWTALASVFFGIFSNSAFTWITVPDNSDNDLIKIVFWASLFLTTLSIIFFFVSWLRYKKTKKDIFIKVEGRTSLRILTAEYGAEGKFIDITNYLNKKIENNHLKIKITNEIAGDPIPGKFKKAKIRYSFGNEIQDIIINENEDLELP